MSDIQQSFQMYLVTTKIGDNEVILGSYKVLSEAKSAIDSHSRLLMNGQSDVLTLYQIPMENHVLHRFTKNELSDAIEQVKKQDYELEARSQVEIIPLETKLKQREEQQQQQSVPVQTLRFEPQQRSSGRQQSTTIAPSFRQQQQQQTITWPSVPEEVGGASEQLNTSRPSVIQRHMQRLQQLRRR